MNSILLLRKCASRADVASLLGYTPKSFSYILFGIPPQQKYSSFCITKRSGGDRTITSPCEELLLLQKKLSHFLYDCVDEINEYRKIERHVSHGFRRKHSILSNAKCHLNRKRIFQIDLKDFFPSINFGRVRGFFLANKNFNLHEDVATTLAQIICFNNELPQGGATSPIVSNLITHPLDVRLARYSTKFRCTYTRYADDLTFSTNMREFPSEIARPDNTTKSGWVTSESINAKISSAGFSINPNKTRMSLSRSRQSVTGIVVNTRPNVPREYRALTRVMVHTLRTSGTIKFPKPAAAGANPMNRLSGMLSHIAYVDKIARNSEEYITSRSLTDFIFYRDFHLNELPTIITEGKTDIIYLRCAIKKLANEFPKLAKKLPDGGTKLQVHLYSQTRLRAAALGLGDGGTSNLARFVAQYAKHKAAISAPGTSKSTIVLTDRDDASKSVLAAASKVVGATLSSNDAKHELRNGMHIVPVPLPNGMLKAEIEDLFDPITLKRKLDGKHLKRSNKGKLGPNEYSKAEFATSIVEKDWVNISFDGFKPLLKVLETLV